MGFTPCSHLCESGCSIYPTRPGLCRDYLCLWRAGIIRGDDSRRPDQLGLMFILDIDGKECRENIVVEAWEMWEGACLDHTPRFVIETIAEQFKVSIRPYGVPISHRFTSKDHLLLAKYLSELSHTDPKQLAAWIEARMADGTLNLPEDSSAYGDLDGLREGIPVPRYYRRPGQ